MERVAARMHKRPFRVLMTVLSVVVPIYLLLPSLYTQSNVESIIILNDIFVINCMQLFRIGLGSKLVLYI